MDKVEKWTEIVKEDLDLDINYDYVKTIAPLCSQIEVMDKGYCLLLCSNNMVNKKVGMIVSFYLKPEFRNYKEFKNLLSIVETTAKENGCKSISFGCEISYNDEQIYKMLDRCGYKDVASVRKEL